MKNPQSQHRTTLYVLSTILLLVGVMLIAKEYVTITPSTFTFWSEKIEVRGPTLSEARPTHLSIPAIGVETNFIELGIDENKEIEVPNGYEEVGWYQYGPTPGELGPAVVLGHVDSESGPAVFYSLGQLNTGDSIEIDRDDGSTAVFRVTELARYEQQSFPTTLVYGDTDHAGLRLITCSGSYDRELQRYDHNLVVYAELVDTNYEETL